MQRRSLVKLILKQVQNKELSEVELAILKEWDRIWQYYDQLPETILALQGIFWLYANPDIKNIEFDVDFTASAPSPFNRLFSDPMSLKEVVKTVLDTLKYQLVGDKTVKTIIKGVITKAEEPESTFAVELKLNEISKIGFKRKKLSGFKRNANVNSATGRAISWTSHRYQGARLDVYQSLKAAIMDGSFGRQPFHIDVDKRHFRYPVYQHKQSLNIMLVLDISNSVKWILKFIDKIITMLTAQANASRDKLGLIVFSDDQAQVMHQPTINVRHVVGTINTLSPKGKTPLAKGARLALQTLEHSRYQVTGMSNAIVLLSDCFPEPITGEYEDQLDEPACEELLHVCDMIGEAKIKLLILNPSICSIKNYEKHIGYRLGKLDLCC